MNILQIVSSSRVSGAEKHVLVLTEYLHKRGHNILALCPPGEWLPPQLRDAGATVLERNMSFTRMLKMANGIKQVMQEHQIDLIHSHLTRATYFGCLMGQLTGKSVVSSVHVHSHDIVYRYILPQPKNHIITVSDWVRNGFINLGVPPKQVHTIYNGTEFIGAVPPPMTEEPLPIHAEFSLPPDAELIGIFARVNEFKGQHLLVRALRRVICERPHAYLICVGPVEPRMQKALWELAATMGVAERVRFTGTRNDVQRILGAMHIVALPSRYEACSMAILEAMAMGKPVIATRAGGNPELVLDNETGLLIERNPDALADAILTILNDSDALSRMGSAARSLAESRFSARIMVDNIEALYRKIVQES